MLELKVITGLWIWLPAFQEVNVNSIYCLAHSTFEHGEHVGILLVIQLNILKDNKVMPLSFHCIKPF